MKKTSTLFLKIVLSLMVLAALAICIFALPAIAKEARTIVDLGLRYPIYAIIAGMYLTVIPFFITIYQAWQLLLYIDENKAFSERSVKALRNIKYCAVAISIFYVAGAPLLYPLAEADDAPGALVIGMIVAGAPIVIAVFAAVLEKLVRSAIDIQAENELTV